MVDSEQGAKLLQLRSTTLPISYEKSETNVHHCSNVVNASLYAFNVSIRIFFFFFLHLEKISSPCQHIPIDCPVPERRLTRIDARGGYFGITVDNKIDRREVLHAFLVAFRLLECFLKESLPFLPGLSHLRKYLQQLAPFLGKAHILPRYLDSTSKESL